MYCMGLPGPLSIALSPGQGSSVDGLCRHPNMRWRIFNSTSRIVSGLFYSTGKGNPDTFQARSKLQYLIGVAYGPLLCYTYTWNM